MATQLASLLTNQILPTFNQEVGDIVERKSALWRFLPQRRYMGGSDIEFQVNTSGNSSAAAFSEGDAEPAAGLQTWVRAQLAWAKYWAKCQISRHAMDVTGGNHFKIGQLVQQELDGKLADLVNVMEGDLISGSATSPQSFLGFSTAVDSTGTYAGLARATYTGWASIETNITPPLTEALMRTLTAALRYSSGKPLGQPTHMLCNPTVFNIIGALLESNRTPMVLQSDGLSARSVSGGFRTVAFEGMSVLEIPGFTANEIDYIQLDDWHLGVLRPVMADTPEREGDDLVWLLSFTGQLVCTNTGRQGKHTNVSS